jgi:DNA (cytosine-5)-methyltransferase 1
MVMAVGPLKRQIRPRQFMMIVGKFRDFGEYIQSGQNMEDPDVRTAKIRAGMKSMLLMAELDIPSGALDPYLDYVAVKIASAPKNHLLSPRLYLTVGRIDREELRRHGGPDSNNESASACRCHSLSVSHERLVLVSTRGIAISLFSGAGGLDLGAERAGYEVRAAVEWDHDAAATMEKNLGHLVSPVIQNDIVKISIREILQAAGMRSSDCPDLLIGGPPCTPFSKSGAWLGCKREGHDPDASLLQEYTRALSEARPRRFVLENVHALTYNNKASRPALDRLLREIEMAGYHFDMRVLNAADYGVPQARLRIFIIGVRKNEPLPTFPEPTHGGRSERRFSGDPGKLYIKAGEALSDLITDPEPGEQVDGKYGHLLPAIPAGDNYLFYTERRGYPDPLFRWRGKHRSFLLKLSPDKPAETIRAQFGPYVGPFHCDNRRLRVGEMKRLFTYPDEYEFVGNRASVQAQLANSVPPLLAERVIRSLASGRD